MLSLNAWHLKQKLPYLIKPESEAEKESKFNTHLLRKYASGSHPVNTAAAEFTTTEGENIS